MVTYRSFVELSYAAALAATCASLDAPARGAIFQGLGDLPGGIFASGTAIGVSRDGQAIVGLGTNATNDMIAFRWTQMDGIVPLGELPGGAVASEAVASSATGKYAVGDADSAAGREAFLWSAAGGMVAIGDLPGGTTNALASDVTADGAIVCGIGNIAPDFVQGEAFRWTQAGGIVGLGFLDPAHEFSDVWGMSADGSVLAGSSGMNLLCFEAFRWTQATGMQGLGQLPGSNVCYSRAWGLSSTGNVVVGEAHFSESEDAEASDACYWTQATGWVSIGDLPGGAHYAVALGTSAGGEVIVGIADFDAQLTSGRAFIWDAAHGIRDLKSVLESDYGLDLSGWQLRIAYDISDDGTVIVGDGVNPSGDGEAWMARLDSPACNADLNADGAVGLTDLAILLSAFGSTCP